MKSKKIIVFIIIIILIIIAGIFLLGNKGGQRQSTNNEGKMVDCGKLEDPGCFVNRMSDCLPTTAKLTATDNKTNIDLIIIGKENGKCHFQRKINDVLNIDCYFPDETITLDILDQTFGNDKGLGDLVDSSCKTQ